ncbi:MAG TPA: helix-turn-helix transcriptional regulator [Lacipirellulaceae bacterium]|nr:helix-turn-helix transcriptional regulator [Lacipirellulaceae bacterium]
MATQTIEFDGKPYVILPRDEYDRLTTLAKAADLPPLPEANASGNYPAVEYALASLARKIIRDRVAAGLSQRELALRAGVRVETLCRIETGKCTPSVASIDKIDRALRQAMQRKTSRSAKTKGAARKRNARK